MTYCPFVQSSYIRLSEYLCCQSLTASAGPVQAGLADLSWHRS